MTKALLLSAFLLAACSPSNAVKAQKRTYHFVSAHESCAKRLLAQLFYRGARNDVHETVVLESNTLPIPVQDWVDRGFDFELIDHDDAKTRFRTQRSTLVVANPDATVAYTSAYCDAG